VQDQLIRRSLNITGNQRRNEERPEHIDHVIVMTNAFKVQIRKTEIEYNTGSCRCVEEDSTEIFCSNI
jgi:hypothetical protein